MTDASRSGTSASLAWYPATRPAWTRLWQTIRADLDLPDLHLSWPDDFDAHWRDPGLVLAMTCAMPLHLGLADAVHVVGTPVWGLPDLPPGQYASHIVTRADDRRPLQTCAEGGIAVNDRASQSGYGTLLTAGLTGPVLVTGSHAASMRAVTEGRAALAAIDVVTWAMTGGEARLAIRRTTPPTPATPFITARADLVAPLRAALSRAIDAMSADDRAMTRLAGMIQLPAATYAARLPQGV